MAGIPNEVQTSKSSPIICEGTHMLLSGIRKIYLGD